MTLATEDTPLVLADGTQIDPRTGRPIKPQIKYVEVPTNTDAVRQVTRVRRTLADLPTKPEQANAISLVVAYTLFGLSDSDIALALSLTLEQVQRMKALEVFSEMRNKVAAGVLEDDAEDIRQMIQSHARNAVRKVVTTMESDDEGLALRAAQDVLDRAGHRPADIVEHRHKLDGELIIKHVEAKAHEVPMIDITPLEE